MKGKRTCKERILAFMLTFAMVVGMVMEPVQLQAAAVEGEPVQEEIVTEEPTPEKEPSVEENGGISLFSADGGETDVTETGTGDGTDTGEGEKITEPGGNEGEEQPPAEKEYEITITAPEEPFYIGETCETPFKATVWNKTDGIDTNTGVLSILNTATENEKISITAKLLDENATSVLSEDTYEISAAVRPQYSITGKVIDQYDQEGIVGATVTLNPTEGSKGQQVTTDTLSDGTFTLGSVVGGTNTNYTLTVTKDGYTSYEHGSFQNAENDIILSENISLNFAEEIQLSQSNLELKVGETKAIDIIWP